MRAVIRSSGPSLLAAGVVVGLGIEAKPQVGLVAAVLVVTLLATGPRGVLRSRWAASGALAAVLLAAPYLIWQQQHGWPQVTVAHNIAGSQEGGRAGFLPFQLVMVSPLLVPVWIAGLRAPFRRPEWRCLRFVPITYAAMGVLYLAGNGHAYYLASLYPLLLGLGAIPTAEWTTSSRRNGRLLIAALVLSAAVGAVIALPLLPERSLQGSVVMAVNPAQGEMVGWPRFVATVSGRVAADPGGSAEPHRDLHLELRRGGCGRAARLCARAASPVQRAQRLQRVGPAAGHRHAGARGRRRWPPRRCARSSPAAGRSRSSTTASASATRSRGCR